MLDYNEMALKRQWFLNMGQQYITLLNYKWGNGLFAFWTVLICWYL